MSYHKSCHKIRYTNYHSHSRNTACIVCCKYYKCQLKFLCMIQCMFLNSRLNILQYILKNNLQYILKNKTLCNLYKHLNSHLNIRPYMTHCNHIHKTMCTRWYNLMYKLSCNHYNYHLFYKKSEMLNLT